MTDLVKKALKTAVIWSLLAVLCSGCQSIGNWFKGDSSPRFPLQGSRLIDSDIDRFYSSIKPRKQGDAGSLFKIAGHLKRQGKHLAAIETLKDILSIDPKNARAYNDMGICYDKIGEYRAAAGCYHRALQIDPELDYVYNNLGYSYLLQGKVTAAIGAFSRAIELSPDHPRYNNNLGLAYSKKGAYNRAGESFRRAGGDAAARKNLAILRSYDGDQPSSPLLASRAEPLKTTARTSRGRISPRQDLKEPIGIDDRYTLAAKQKIMLLPMKTIEAEHVAQVPRPNQLEIARLGRPQKTRGESKPETAATGVQSMELLSPQEAKSLFLAPENKRGRVKRDPPDDADFIEYNLAAALDPGQEPAGTLIKSFKLQVKKTKAPRQMVGISLKGLDNALQTMDADPNSKPTSKVRLLPLAEIPADRNQPLQVSAAKGLKPHRSPGLLSIQF